jgi:hypothetical protein
MPSLVPRLTKAEREVYCWQNWKSSARSLPQRPNPTAKHSESLPSSDFVSTPLFHHSQVKLRFQKAVAKYLERHYKKEPASKWFFLGS